LASRASLWSHTRSDQEDERLSMAMNQSWDALFEMLTLEAAKQ
jgi:hypothetical protein